VNKKNQVLKEAFRILSITDVSETKLKSLLEKRGYKEPELSETIEYLKKRNFISDIRLANLLTEKYIKKKKGSNYIRCILSGKGISEKVISEVLAKTYPESLEYKVAKELLSSLKKPLKKTFYVLNSSGFSEQVIERLKEEKCEQ